MAAIALATAVALLAGLAPYWIEPALIDDDARMHLLGPTALRSASAFHDRFLSDYSLGYVPSGYRWLMSAAATALPPLLVSKALGALLLMLAWWLAWRVGCRLGGPVGAAGSLLLCVHSGFVFLHTFGGLHRAFGYPLLLAFVCAWVERRDRLLGAVLLGQALFYPPVFLVCWSAWALRIAAARRRWLSTRRIGLAAFFASTALAAAVLLTFADTPAEWGPLATLDDAARMGEFQRDGGRIKLLPLSPLWIEVVQSVRRGVLGLPETADRVDRPFGEPLDTAAAIGLVLLCAPALLLARPRPAWAPALFGSAIVVYGVARELALRLGEPDRALKFTLPVLVILAWPLAWGAADRLGRHRAIDGAPASVWPRRAAVFWRVGLGAALVAVLALPGPWTRGIEAFVVDARPERALHDALAQLDRRDGPVLVAGWPGPGAPIDNVPLLAEREVFVDYEHAHPYYLGYYAVVRRRIEDVVRLTYATDVAEAIEIRDRNGLTHLIVERTVHERAGVPPRLHRPLDAFALAVAAERPATRRIFRAPPLEWIVYEDPAFRVIDLRAIEDPARR